MTFINTGGGRAVALLASAVVGLAAPLVLGLSAANADLADRDGDGMPNRWERRHGLNPLVANARRDRDRDGLVNIAEFRRHTRPVDEDTDNDGHDDGDEVKDGFRSTFVLDANTDDDRLLDGDEDADHDGIDNEDEDDVREACRADDDDRDGDHVDDEDENELGLSARDSDSDDDGLSDGDEDGDEDGEVNEDADDADVDECEDADEDEGDVLGTVATFDAETGVLTVATESFGTLQFTLTEDTEIEIESTDEEGSTADLTPGRVVAEVELDDETGTVEEVELY